MIRFNSVLASVLFMAFSTPSLFAQPTPVVLKKDDRIVFLGDSITQGGNGGKGYIQVIRNEFAEKKKDLAIECIGAGISGNKVPNLQARVDKDVIAKKPTIVFIYIGINDVWHGESDPKKGTLPEAFESGLKEVIGKCTKAGAQVIVCTPTVIGELPGGANKLDSRLDEYANISRRVAKELNLNLCDLRKAFAEHIASNNPDKKAAGVLTTDRVHLNEAGNKLVANTMLKSLGQ